MWMAWNAYAHDGPLHFFRRVSTFKQGIGEGSTDTLAALLLYPKLLATTRPDVVFAAAWAHAFVRRRAIARRWLVPLLCAAAQLAFLAIGNARDGAPAHHPERALLPTTFLMAAFAMDTLATVVPRLPRRPRVLALGCASVVVAAWIVAARPLFGPPPGSSEAEDRRPQIARGHALASEPHLVIEPCAFEHFALVAAYGAPERVVTLRRTNAPVTPDCPRVEAR
jgi:hypothetical protein